MVVVVVGYLLSQCISDRQTIVKNNQRIVAVMWNKSFVIHKGKILWLSSMGLSFALKLLLSQKGLSRS